MALPRYGSSRIGNSGVTTAIKGILIAGAKKTAEQPFVLLLHGFDTEALFRPAGGRHASSRQVAFHGAAHGLGKGPRIARGTIPGHGVFGSYFRHSANSGRDNGQA